MTIPATGIKAIREKCLDCCGGSQADVRYCTASACPLWGYRMGKYPETLRKQEPELLQVTVNSKGVRRFGWE